MEYRVTVKYTPKLIKFAARQFWWRSIGIGGFITFALMVALFAYLLIIGDRSWLLGITGATVLLSFLFGVAAYRIFLARPLEKFWKLNDAAATFRFSDTGIGVESAIGTTEISWTFIEKIWMFADVWLIFYPKQGYSTLPVAGLDEELKQFILSRVRESGGKIIQY